MIVRHEALAATANTTWTELAAPVPTDAIAWRQDGKIVERDGRFFARFVCYIDANTVRERLDRVVPGEWDLTVELLPSMAAEDGESTCAFKARLQVCGVVREDVGMGRDYKQAATDAFKRAAVRFGIGHELYAYDQHWVEMDGNDRSARPVEDPQTAYDRRHANAGAYMSSTRAGVSHDALIATAADEEIERVSCPKCGGKMWDNRLTKRNPKAPDFKCRNRSCDGVIWPAKQAADAAETAESSQVA
jgi:hypothetical protein